MKMTNEQAQCAYKLLSETTFVALVKDAEITFEALDEQVIAFEKATTKIIDDTQKEQEALPEKDKKDNIASYAIKDKYQKKYDELCKKEVEFNLDVTDFRSIINHCISRKGVTGRRDIKLTSEILARISGVSNV